MFMPYRVVRIVLAGSKVAKRSQRLAWDLQAGYRAITALPVPWAL
jgi:hypothetical protein